MSRLKQKSRGVLAIAFAFIMVIQTVIGQPGLFVLANDAEKSALQLAIEEHFDTYESSYADSETAEMALATAKKQVQAVISANESGATFNVSNGYYKRIFGTIRVILGAVETDSPIIKILRRSANI